MRSNRRKKSDERRERERGPPNKKQKLFSLPPPEMNSFCEYNIDIVNCAIVFSMDSIENKGFVDSQVLADLEEAEKVDTFKLMT